MKAFYGIVLLIGISVKRIDANCLVPKSIANGVVTCQGKGDPGTQCTFQCNKGFERDGAPRIICTGGKGTGWRNSPPTCEPVCKPLPPAPKYGFKTCKGCGELGTVCTFDCDIGYELDGDTYTECERSGRAAAWSNETPICKKIEVNECEKITKSGLTVKCNRVKLTEGTVCTFECDEGLELQPEAVTKTKCVKKGEGFTLRKKQLKWSVEPPCCVDCSKIKRDIIILMDASDSVSVNDWKLMRAFIRNLVGKFEIGQKSVRFEIIQYAYGQQVLGGKRKTFFGQGKRKILNILSNWASTSGGTYTGSALKFIRDSMLKPGKKGNRKNVNDMLWIFTDGKTEPKREFILAKKEAKAIRDSGVDVLALAVGDYKQFEDQLETLTGDSSKIIKVENTKGLTNKIVNMVSKKICDKTCV